MVENSTLEQKTDAVQRGVRRALREHALLGFSVPVMREGQLVRLSPQEILEEFGQQEQELGTTDDR